MKRFKDLSIKKKFAIAFVIDGCLIGMTAILVTYFSLIVGLDRIENSNLETTFYNVVSAINRNQDLLLMTVKDYANWDDMYNYVNTKDEKWTKANITDWIPQNFGIDLILLLDNQDELVYQYGDFDEFSIGKDVLNHPLIKEAVNVKEMRGFYSTSKGIMSVASSEIMHTDQSGPRNGTYLYGRFINVGRLNELKDVTGIDLSIIADKKVMDSTFSEQVQRPKNFDDIYKDLTSKKFAPFSIHKLKTQFSFVYGVLKDTTGKDIAMLELISPRSSVAFVKSFFIKIAIGVMIFMVISVFITILAITGALLKPLDILKITIEEIQKTKDMLKRVNIDSRDEVGILAKDFNTMMDTLDKAQKELQTAQQNLIRSEKMATAAEFAMGTVHRINNPLSIVIGRVQILRRLLDYKTPIPQVDLENDLKIIEKHTKRAIEISNSLLRYAAQTTFRFEKCDVNELLKELISLVRETFESQMINITENLKPGLPLLQYCDASQMHDVFMNIMTNAVQAMPGGGTLEISTYYDERDNTVNIKFTDTGYGISPENIDKIFTPFFSTKTDRTGLGLAISYNVIKAHGGIIGVESEVGKGSTFTVKLPAEGRS